MILLHDQHTIQQIDWTSKKEGAYVRDYFVPILENGTEMFIKNVKSKVYLLEIDDLILPVTVNETEFENSYVCSPYTHYISYAKEELWELHMPMLEGILSKLIDCIGLLLRRSSINRVVSVNNWFLSTNLYCPLTESQIERITTLLIKKFPTHTILFRSILEKLHQPMFDSFEQIGYQNMMSRSVYLFHPERFQSLTRKARKDFLNDEALMRKTAYEVVDASDLDDSIIPIIEQLYEELYIKKYSEHNPQFTTNFYTNAWKHRLIQFKLLKDHDSYDGVIGYFHRHHVLTTPILGYRMELNAKKGLYRLLSLCIAKEVLEQHYTGHFSAGAGEFKRNRGSVQEIEYSFFYNKHLPQKSQFVWKALKFILDKLVEPMARKWGF